MLCDLRQSHSRCCVLLQTVTVLGDNGHTTEPGASGPFFAKSHHAMRKLGDGANTFEESKTLLELMEVEAVRVKA